MWNHRNLRLFDAQRRIISHQPADLFVRVWHAYEELNYVCGTGARVLVCACVGDRSIVVHSTDRKSVV